MKLLGHTILQHENAHVNYEILQLNQLLVFKPFFYHVEQEFPCIFLNDSASGWRSQDGLDESIDRQIREDLASLKFTA